MVPWEFLDSVPVPGSKGELRLYKRGEGVFDQAGSLRTHEQPHATARRRLWPSLHVQESPTVPAPGS